NKGVLMDTALITSDENVAQTQRELGPFEHLLWLVDQWTPRHFVFVSRIEGRTISAANLKTALLRSQHRHPLLRTTIHVDEDGNPEFVPSSALIWLRVVPRANNTQWLREVNTQLALPFELGDCPLMRVALVQRGKNSSARIAPSVRRPRTSTIRCATPRLD